MSTFKYSQGLSALAVVLSAASLAIVASLALRTGHASWLAFTPPFVILLGAGRSLAKSRAEARTPGRRP